MLELSKRLKTIVSKIEKCYLLADIGTDHGYVPIYAIKNNLCNRAIASDINLEPVKRARNNILWEGLKDKISVRQGAGLKPFVIGEAEIVIIAGMGGHLICDILKDDIEKVKKLKYLILQPAQNPEVLREYLYCNNYEIIDEDLCEDEGIIYEIFKVRWDKNAINEALDKIYYEISPFLLQNNNPLINKYIIEKRDKCKKILSFINEDTEGAKKRVNELKEKISLLNELLEAK